MIYEPERLSQRILLLLEDQDNQLVISHASIWELLNKVGRGNMLLAGTSVTRVLQRILELDVDLLPVTLENILAAADLPHLHSDPFDRMLIAQALAEGLTLLTTDGMIRKYAVSTVWK